MVVSNIPGLHVHIPVACLVELLREIPLFIICVHLIAIYWVPVVSEMLCLIFINVCMLIMYHCFWRVVRSK